MSQLSLFINLLGETLIIFFDNFRDMLVNSMQSLHKIGNADIF